MPAKTVSILVLVSLLLPTAAHARELTVAAASDLAFALPEIVSAFEKKTGHTVRVSYGSSGNFYSQLSQGAPFDLFFSADADYPRRLEAAGFVRPGSRAPYAVGRIVLWVPNGSPIDAERDGLRALLHPFVKRVAIANPRHAPYGKAAVAALRHSGIYEAIEKKLVFGENMAQAAQFVQSGSAQAGLVALSVASAPAMRRAGRYWEVPQEKYPKLMQEAVILRWSRQPELAAYFLAHLRSAESQAVLRGFGFLSPEDTR